MKRCSLCRMQKEFTEFNVHRNTKDGFLNYCKPCANAYYKAYNASRSSAKQTVVLQSKVCRKCHLEKPISQFGVKNNLPDKHNIYCKPCNKNMTYASMVRNGK